MRAPVLLIALLVASPAADRWPQFRGPGGHGIPAEEGGLPLRWSATENVRWSVEVPGHGWSSPIVWGDRVYVTSAVSGGAFKEPSPGIYGNDYIAELRAQGLPPEEVSRRVRARDTETADEASAGVRWMLFAFDTGDGALVWEREVHRGVPFGGRHRKNTYASETPVTDGERIWVLLGNVGAFCYSRSGELLWEHRFEPRPTYLDFGTAASPLLHDGRLYVVRDNEQDGRLLALDADSGQLLWERDRTSDHPLIRTGFSTPYLWRNRVRSEIVVLGPARATSYDPATGEELWHLDGTSAVAAPTPVAGADLLLIGSGSPSENVRPLFAVRPGGLGDISLAEGETENEHVAWYRPRDGSYITSPIAYRGRVYVLYDKGFFAGFDAGGGQLFKGRIGRGGNAFSASPWAYDGRIFCLSESGDTFVFRAGDEYELLAVNPLEELTLATPAVADGSLYVRTYTRLYRIAREEAAPEG